MCGERPFCGAGSKEAAQIAVAQDDVVETVGDNAAGTQYDGVVHYADYLLQVVVPCSGAALRAVDDTDEVGATWMNHLEIVDPEL